MQDRRVNRGATSGGVRRGITYTKQGMRTWIRTGPPRGGDRREPRCHLALNKLVVSYDRGRPRVYARAAGKGTGPRAICSRDQVSTEVGSKGSTEGSSEGSTAVRSEKYSSEKRRQ
jgi:hypothetical protein